MRLMQALVHPDGRLVLRNEAFRAALGRSGVRVHKQEGDGATPVGLLPLRRVLYRLDRLPPPDCAVPIEPIAETDGWCDDPTHRDYNRPVRLPHEARCEELWRQDGLYDVVGVLGWNDAPVVNGTRLGDLPARRTAGLRADGGLRCAGTAGFAAHAGRGREGTDGHTLSVT